MAEAGIRASVLTGKSSKKERSETIRQLQVEGLHMSNKLANFALQTKDGKSVTELVQKESEPRDLIVMTSVERVSLTMTAAANIAMDLCGANPNCWSNSADRTDQASARGSVLLEEYFRGKDAPPREDEEGRTGFILRDQTFDASSSGHWPGHGRGNLGISRFGDRGRVAKGSGRMENQS